MYLLSMRIFIAYVMREQTHITDLQCLLCSTNLVRQSPDKKWFIQCLVMGGVINSGGIHHFCNMLISEFFHW